MIEFLKRIFVWWHDSTFGTSFTLWRSKARKVGEDAQGNLYFEEGGKPSHPEGGGKRRRWVVYHGVAESSRVPPEWYGWLHHTLPDPPTETPLPQKKFERPHLPNMTGTPLAYRPRGALALAGRPGTEVDDTYEAWSPENA